MSASEQLKTQFKSVLKSDEKVSELVESLGGLDLIPLLVKFKGLEKIEGDELKSKLRRKSGRERNRTVIERVSQKDSLSAFIALSQVIEFKNKYIWTQLFSFAEGTHGTLQYKSPLIASKQLLAQPSLIQPASQQPTVMWLCDSEDIFKLAADNFAKPDTPLQSILSGTIKYYVLPSLNDCDVNVWLCLPFGRKGLQGIDFHKLYQTFCDTKCCLLTGRCTVVNEPRYQNGDICVTKTGQAFQTSLEHKTEEWKGMNDVDQWHCSKRRENDLEVVFGKVGWSISDTDSVDFVSEEGSFFCEKSEEACKKGAKMHYAAVLMATEDDKASSISEKCECGERNIMHTLNYSYKLIEDQVTNKSLLKYRSGRNPSI